MIKSGLCDMLSIACAIMYFTSGDSPWLLVCALFLCAAGLTAIATFLKELLKGFIGFLEVIEGGVKIENRSSSTGDEQ